MRIVRAGLRVGSGGRRRSFYFSRSAKGLADVGVTAICGVKRHLWSQGITRPRRRTWLTWIPRNACNLDAIELRKPPLLLVRFGDSVGVEGLASDDFDFLFHGDFAHRHILRKNVSCALFGL
jgi:hypothetical protein